MPTTSKSLKRNSYSDVDKRQAAVLYLMHGVMSKVAESTGIPEMTLSDWKRTDDRWQELCVELRTQTTDTIRAEVDSVVHLAMKEVKDRLKFGDYKMTAKGEVRRIPVSARDAGWLAAVNIDKRQVLSNQPTSITSTAVDGRIASMLEQFKALGRELSARTIEGEVIPGDSTL